MKIVKIKNIKKLDKVYDRYDLTVGSTNNFFANGMLIHNTSAIFSNILVKNPIRFNIVQKMFNKHFHKKIKALHKAIKSKPYNKGKYLEELNFYKKRKPKTFIEKYDNIYSSRSVIKNEYINTDVTSGYYSTDIWGEYNKILAPYVEKGMSLYGEIVGYLTGSQSMIQKKYDYGCNEGENFFMPYRIVTKNENGVKKEWSITEIEKWTKKLIKEHPELKRNVRPITILYHGTLADLYPEIPVTDHWHENVLEALKKDKVHFNMEENEPLCKNKVPREGFVLRIDDDKVPEAFKLKCLKFYNYEKGLIDKGEVDFEMSQGYSEEV